MTTTTRVLGLSFNVDTVSSDLGSSVDTAEEVLAHQVLTQLKRCVSTGVDTCTSMKQPKIVHAGNWTTVRHLDNIFWRILKRVSADFEANILKRF